MDEKGSGTEGIKERKRTADDLGQLVIRQGKRFVQKTAVHKHTSRNDVVDKGVDLLAVTQHLRCGPGSTPKWQV